MPDWLEPMAATLTQERFSGGDWLFERKFDGIRLLAYKRGASVELYSRNRLPQNLPEVARAVRGRIPVFLDGGVRHGTDIYKALASGASGVGIGRPYIWGLSAFGEEGVERVLEILRAELRMTMQQMGTPAVEDITAERVVRT